MTLSTKQINEYVNRIEDECIDEEGFFNKEQCNYILCCLVKEVEDE